MTLSDRAFGVFAVVGGGVLSCLYGILPLMAAARHEQRVDYYSKAVIFAPVLLIFGIVSIALGERSRPILGVRQGASLLGWIVFILSIGIGLLLDQLCKYQLRKYGYQV